jgi:hypothetical protein
LASSARDLRDLLGIEAAIVPGGVGERFVILMTADSGLATVARRVIGAARVRHLA